MSAVANPRPLHAPSRMTAPLRIVIAAGGWSNALVLLGLALGLLVQLLPIEPGKAFGLGVILAAVSTMFWAMLAGGRLLGMFVLSSRLRLPHVGRTALACLAWALVMAVLLPALAHAGDGRYALAAAALVFGAALGLFWVSLPPWSMWVVIALGVSLRWLPSSMEGGDWVALFTSPAAVAAAALALLAASVLCGWRQAMHPTVSSPWSTPLALILDNGFWLQPGQAQSGFGSPLLGMDTPVGSDLRREPEQALGIALGPGFGRTTPKSALATQGPIIAVVLLWMLLGAGGGDSGDAARDIGLKFAPLLALSTAFAPFMRLQTLYLRPSLGLHELALLPGLPAPTPARSLLALLLRQVLARLLPALVLLGGYGLYTGAARSYFHLLLWTTFASAMLIGGMLLLSLHSRAMRWTSAGVVAAVVLAMLTTMVMPTRTDGSPDWLLPAWGMALLAGAGLWSLAAARLQALPHPWLQN